MKHVTTATMALALGAPLQAQDRPSVAPRNMQEIAPGLAGYTDGVLFGDVWERGELSPRDRSLVTVSVLIATGKVAQLKGHLGRGLSNGITPLEVSGLVTHLAFYTGWPNAVSALAVIEEVFAERKIDTAPLRALRDGPAPFPAPGSAQAADVAQNLAPVAPKFAQLTGDVVFGDLWRRTDLSPRDRSLVTLAALAGNGETDQLAPYIDRALQNGLTQQEIAEAFTHLAFYAGWPKAQSAITIAGEVFANRAATGAGGSPGVQVVPPGQRPVAGPARNFSGAASVASPFKGTGAARLGGATVTFQPGAHTNWHSHPLGQLLVVTQGTGLVQADGEAVRVVKAGDVVWTAPGIRHWHGAGPDGAMTHVAVSEALNGKSVTWMEPVTDAQYRAR